jgi:hypothetical protein
MRYLVLAVALACVLSGVVCAGEIHTTGAVAPPPPSTTPGEIPGTTPGEIHTTSAPEESSTALTIILTLISIVP